MNGLFYVGCVFLAIAAAFLVMWRRIPTGVAGSLGLSLIALVCSANASDWFTQYAPYVNFSRVVMFYVGIILVLIWGSGAEMRNWYSKFWSDPKRNRRHGERRQNPDSVFHPPEEDDEK